MAKLTIMIGILLTLLGVGFYVGLTVAEGSAPERDRPDTGLCGSTDSPAWRGGPEGIDPQARHARSLVVGAAGSSCFRWADWACKLVRGADIKTTVLVSLVLMAVLCGILLAACIRSFVRARLG